jgi:glycosyltransferase involved in cell wall biosynthesis
LSDPFFSIIIPTFNRGPLILDSVTSILRQGNVALELIVVDDGSTDNTAQLIKDLNDTRIKYIKTVNRERGAARNSGLQIASGSYINYFDSDDILNPCLFDLFKFITENNSPNVVYGLIETFTERGKTSRTIQAPRFGFKTSLLQNNFLACGSVFIKRTIALTHLFSEDRKLSGTEDWELWLRIYSSHDFIKFPGIVFKQRLHSLRSLDKVPAQKVTERETAFIDHIKKSQSHLLKRFTKVDLNSLIADRYTLIALAQTETGSKKLATEYLVKSWLSSFRVIARRRFWAVLKKLIAD